METNEQNQAGASTGEEANTGAPAGDVGNTASVTGDKAQAASTQKPPVANQPAEVVNYETKYKELQRAYTQETQKRSAWEKRWGAMESRLEEQAKHLAEMRKQPYDREKFLAEFQDKGPDALRPFWEENLKSLQQEHSKAAAEQADTVRKLQTRIVLNERRSDVENFPDFKKLEPVIVSIMDDPNCPVDFSKPMDQVIDVLYQLARQSSSAEAIQLAEQDGKRKAEASLVRESRSTVTGGGKAASITAPDLEKLDIKQLREHFVQLNGAVDRD